MTMLPTPLPRPARPARLLSGVGLLLLLLLAACETSPAPTALPSPTAIPPTATTLPPTAVPTATVAPPTATTVPPTATTVPPTVTPVPPLPTVTATRTEGPPTERPTVPPTARRTPAATPPAPTRAPALSPTAASTVPVDTTALPGTPEPGDTTPLPTDTAVPPATYPPPPLAGNGGRVAGDLSEVGRGLRGKHQVALTFDAGAGRGQPEEIVRVLQAHGVHITFFLTGAWVAENPDAARAIAAGGHEIANHSYDHPSFFKISDDAMRGQIDRAEAQIQTTTGQAARPYFRAPYGDTNDHVDAVVRGHGYRDFLWTLDSLDSVGKPKSADFIYNRICNTSWLEMDGAIFLQHMAAPASVEALPRILDTLAERGWHVVTLTQLLTP